MSFRNRLVLSRLVLPAVLSALAVLAGCGSGSNSACHLPAERLATLISMAPMFSVWVGRGTGAGRFRWLVPSRPAVAPAGPYRRRTMDFVDNSSAAPASAVGTNSTYSVGADGRGTASLYITPSGGTPFESFTGFRSDFEFAWADHPVRQQSGPAAARSTCSPVRSRRVRSPSSLSPSAISGGDLRTAPSFPP